MHKFLIVGLGNIGSEYEGTRHNVGFDVLAAFAKKHEVPFTTERLAAVAKIKWKGNLFTCIQPSTYMNLSGKAARYWMEKENISLDHILVIVDEVALPLDKLRLRPGGSDGGHNGLKSMQEELRTDQYPRLRFGIGNDYPKGRQVEYVLGRWTESELVVVRLKIQKTVELIESFAQVGIANTMNQFNKLTFQA
jgi:PTH1 family peptidyl-tRNA hydrolase